MVNKFDTAKYEKKAFILITVLFLIIIIWGYFAPLRTLAVAQGKIVATGENKPIQYLGNGVVKKIFVKNGDEVKKGDILIKIDDTQFLASFNIKAHQFSELKIKKDRLIAQRNNLKNINFSNDYEINNKNEIEKLKKIQISIFLSQKRLIETQKKIIRKKILALKEQLSGIKKSIKNKKTYINSIKEEIKELQTLYDEKLIDKVKLRNLKRKKIELQGQLSDLETKLASTKVDINKNEEEIIKIDREFRAKVLDELKKTLSNIKKLEEEIIAIKDKMKKTNIVSPIDGIVDELKVYNIGQVVRNGEVLMVIVPKNSGINIEASLSTKDIDNVMVGQKADIIFNSFNTRMTFYIDGVVTYVSADRKVDKKGNFPYYRVDIAITKKGFEQLKEYNFKLKVGMPATIMIKTGSRTFLSYILKKFLDMKIKAFNEE